MSATRCSSERRLAAPLLALCLLGMLLAPLLAPAPLLAQTSAPAPAAAAPHAGGGEASLHSQIERAVRMTKASTLCQSGM